MRIASLSIVGIDYRTQATEFIVSHFHYADAWRRYIIRIFFLAQYCLIIYLLFETRTAPGDGPEKNGTVHNGGASHNVSDDIEGEGEKNE